MQKKLEKMFKNMCRIIMFALNNNVIERAKDIEAYANVMGYHL
jgi:hypothetical protein